MIAKWLHKGQISQEEYDAVIKKLDGHDAEFKGQIIRDVLETVKEQNEIYLAEREKQIRAEVVDLIDRHLWNYSHEVWEDFKPILEQLKEQKNG